jgi:U3 small nucleolar RNA-associated protein 20
MFVQLTKCYSLDELKTLAIEVQELIQSKVGTTKFAEVYSRIRQNVLGVRRERKTARAVQVRPLSQHM